MRVVEVVWVREIAEKVHRKHRLTTVEVEEVCLARDTHVRRARERRYALFGRTEAGRYVLVIFERIGPGQILIVTARDMTDDERRIYERHAQ